MRHADVLCAGAANGTHQTGPVGVVGHHKAAVHTTPPAPPTHLHPAAGKRVGRIGAEALHPRRALGGGRREHQRALERGFVERGVAHPVRFRQRHAGRAVHRVQRLHRAMHHDRPDARVYPAEHPLRLAKRVTQQHRSPPLVGIASPPSVDLVEQNSLRGPAVDRQAEGGLGDKGVAAHRLKWRAGAVCLGFVVARGHPHPTAMLQPHLRRAQYVPSRMQRKPHTVVNDRLAVIQRLQRDVGPESLAQRALAERVGQVVGVARSRVVRMAVRDHRAVHRTPGVDVEVARKAIQAFGAGDDEVRVGRGHRVCSVPQRGARAKQRGLAGRPWLGTARWPNEVRHGRANPTTGGALLSQSARRTHLIRFNSNKQSNKYTFQFLRSGFMMRFTVHSTSEKAP